MARRIQKIILIYIFLNELVFTDLQISSIDQVLGVEVKPDLQPTNWGVVYSVHKEKCESDPNFYKQTHSAAPSSTANF